MKNLKYTWYAIKFDLPRRENGLPRLVNIFDKFHFSRNIIDPLRVRFTGEIN